MLLMIDNYDSFTYNLVQYFGELGAQVQVRRNDRITLGEIEALAPTHLVISPGPGTPADSGISTQAIAHFAGRMPILGVCLGHQAIGSVFGSNIVRAKRVMHGKTSPIHHIDSGVFKQLPSPYLATRYHSLVVAEDSLPECLEVTAWTEEEDGSREEIMGLRHRKLAIEGVQFHPESLVSEHGHALLQNFLSMSVQ